MLLLICSRLNIFAFLSIDKKMHLLFGVNYKQCGTMKGLNNQILKSGKSFLLKGDQLDINKGLGP